MQLMKSFIGATCTIKLLEIHVRFHDSLDIDECTLSTVMELLTVLTIKAPSAVSAEKTTLAMGYHVNLLVRIMSNFSKIIFS